MDFGKRGMTGALHEYMVHSQCIWFSRKRGRRANTSDATVHAVPAALCRYPLMPERDPLALWATPAHASLMASMTTDGILAVYDDRAGLRSAKL